MTFDDKTQPGYLQFREYLESYDPHLIGKSIPKRAAVAIIFLVSNQNDPRLIFIKRAEHPDDPWSGHMAFPGGRVDPDDKDIIDAAYRETREEIDLDLATDGQLISRINDIRAIARGKRLPMVISPFVFFVETEPTFICNEEVVEIHRIPLSFFLDSSNKSTLTYSIKGLQIPLPCYRYKNRVIWGLTHRMIQNLFKIMNIGSS